MMYPRLYLARNLLSDDGVLVISIDDNEVANLRKLCDEILGEENFVSQISVQSNPRGRQSDTFVATVHDYLLVYTRLRDSGVLGGVALTEQQKAEFDLVDEDGSRYRLLGLRQRGSASRREDRPDMYFPIYVDPSNGGVSLDPSESFSIEVLPRKSTGEDGRWMWGVAKVRRDIRLVESKLIARRGEYDIFVRDHLEKSGGERKRKFKTIWDDKAFNTQNGTQEVKALLGSDAMPFPKPSALIEAVVNLGAGRDGLILDFFAGSGTTGHAVMEVNRQDRGNRRFILVQLPEPTGRDDYRTIAEICKERVRRVIDKMNADDAALLTLQEGEQPDRGFRVFKLGTSNFTTWDTGEPGSAEVLEQRLELHVDHIRDGRIDDDLLCEILLKSGFPLTTPVETLELAGKRVYIAADGALLLCLDRELTLDLIREMAQMAPERVVCLDEGFAGNDQLKTNAVQLFKAKGVSSFKTV
jgi:adenine-specific DNA-methyltransferase